MKEAFIIHSFAKSTLVRIEQANTIIAEYMSRGFVLSLRQLHYQFVSRALYDNTFRNYKNLGNTLRDARLAGLVDWDALEDRGRAVEGGWRDDGTPADYLNKQATLYSIDYWRDQLHYVEVWIEKAALLGVIEDVCSRHGVRYYAHRGDDSKSPSYRAGKRLKAQIDQGRIPLILHPADHDPRGVHFTPYIAEELEMFVGEPVEVRRLALTHAQVLQFAPPPNFVKEKDNLTPAYERQTGFKTCWELDALSPEVISGLIEDELNGIINWDRWEAMMTLEEQGQTRLKANADAFAASEE